MSLWPNTGPQWLPAANPGTGYAGTTNSQVPSYVTNGLPARSYYDQSAMDAIEQQYRPIGQEGRTTQGSANLNQAAAAEQAALTDRAKQMLIDRGWSRNDSNIIGDPGERNLSGLGTNYGTRTNTGSRTGLSPGQLGRAIADYESGKSNRKNADALYSDYFEMAPEAQEIAYSNAESGNKSGSTSGLSNKQNSLKNKINNQRVYQSLPPGGPPISYPSYSANPAGGYTNVTPLGPQGDVSIHQGTPADLGWSTGSAYDPNTGLSKWSTNGLTNGEMYYDNLYAGQRNAEAQRKAAQAASSAAALQRRIIAGERQDLRNEVVNALVAGGRDKSMARIDAKNMTDAELISRVQQIEQDNAVAQQRTGESALNDLLAQFSNPNYGGSYGSAQQVQVQGTISDPLPTQQQGSVQQQYQQAVQDQQQYQEQQEALQRQQQELSQQYQQQLDAANAANNARYEDIIRGYQDNQANIDSYLTNQGQQQTEDVNRSYERLGASNRQDLISRGLGNTTVLSSTERGIEEDRQRALRNSQEQIDRQRLTYQTAAQSDLLGAMERRTDAGPDYNQLIGLSQGLGNSQNSVPATGGYGNQVESSIPAYGQNQGGGYQAPNSTGISTFAPSGQTNGMGESVNSRGQSESQYLYDQSQQNNNQANLDRLQHLANTGQAPAGSNNERALGYAEFANLSELDQDRWRQQIRSGNRTWEDFTGGGQVYDTMGPSGATQGGYGLNGGAGVQNSGGFVPTGMNSGGSRINAAGQTIGEYNQSQSGMAYNNQPQQPRYQLGGTNFPQYNGAPQYQPVFGSQQSQQPQQPQPAPRPSYGKKTPNSGQTSGSLVNPWSNQQGAAKTGQTNQQQNRLNHLT